MMRYACHDYLLTHKNKNYSTLTNYTAMDIVNKLPLSYFTDHPYITIILLLLISGSIYFSFFSRNNKINISAGDNSNINNSIKGDINVKQ